MKAYSAMLRSAANLLLLSALVGAFHPAYIHAETPLIPQNLGQLKEEVRAFYTDGTYEEICEELMEPAMRIIEEWEGEGKPALVLDVDDTSISTLDNMLARDFGYISAEWLRWARQGRASAITPTLELAKLAGEKGFAIFFITSRLETLRKPTESNLRRAGYPKWTELIMKRPGDWQVVSSFKAEQRRRIEEEGYTIVLNIGDQQSDVEGGHALHQIVLPNPAYYIP